MVNLISVLSLHIKLIFSTIILLLVMLFAGHIVMTETTYYYSELEENDAQEQKEWSLMLEKQYIYNILPRYPIGQIYDYSNNYAVIKCSGNGGGKKKYSNI